MNFIFKSNIGILITMYFQLYTTELASNLFTNVIEGPNYCLFLGFSAPTNSTAFFGSILLYMK